MRKSISLALFIVIGALACTDNSSEKNYSTISGLWNCDEIDEYSALRNYIVDIDNVVNSNNIFIIVNFHNAGNDFFVRATVNEENLIISKQAIGNYLVEGTGIISPDNKRIELEYKVFQESSIRVYQCLYWR
ncbi:MAG: hypothetical protein JXB34_05320 [Bacteroidales bacterium]|nr:hypothetical protein [Bacteroidales bacterium]